MKVILGVKIDYNDFVVEFFPDTDDDIKKIVKPYDVAIIGDSIYVGQMFEYMPTNDDVDKVQHMVKTYLDQHVLWNEKNFGLWNIELDKPKMVDWNKR